MHGHGRQRFSEFKKQLYEKQKLRYNYGVSEKQLRNLFTEAKHSHDPAGLTLLRLLEQRLDNVIRRLGWARTIWQARQLVAHGHVLVNGRKNDIPSRELKVGDEIKLKEKSQKYVRDTMESLPGHEAPSWLTFDPSTLTAKVVAVPTSDQVPFDVNMNLIIEFYR